MVPVLDSWFLGETSELSSWLREGLRIWSCRKVDCEIMEEKGFVWREEVGSIELNCFSNSKMGEDKVSKFGT